MRDEDDPELDHGSVNKVPEIQPHSAQITGTKAKLWR